jgi:hypothetical protein
MQALFCSTAEGLVTSLVFDTALVLFAIGMVITGLTKDRSNPIKV